MHEQLGLLTFLILAVLCGGIQICIGNTTARRGLRGSAAVPPEQWSRYSGGVDGAGIINPSDRARSSQRGNARCIHDERQ